MSWIRLHRETIHNQCFAHPGMWRLWTWLLIKANYKDSFASIKSGRGISSIEVKRGQLIFGRFTAEEELDVDGSTLYKWMNKLEQWEMIKIESNSQYSLITLCNYDYYNPDEDIKEQPSNSEVITKEQPSNSQVTHLKNNNNPIEVKENISREITREGFSVNYVQVKAYFDLNEKQWEESLQMANHIDRDTLKKFQQKFIIEITGTKEQYGSLQKGIGHFARWLPKELKTNKPNGNKDLKSQVAELIDKK